MSAGHAQVRGLRRSLHRRPRLSGWLHTGGGAPRERPGRAWCTFGVSPACYVPSASPRETEVTGGAPRAPCGPARRLQLGAMASLPQRGPGPVSAPPASAPWAPPQAPAADTLGGPAPLLGLTLQSRARRHLVEVLRAPEPPSWAPPAPRHDPATGGTEVGAVPHGFVCTDGPLRAPHTPCGPCPRGEKRRPASPRPGPRLNEAWPSSALEGGWIRQVHPGGDPGASGRNGTDRRPASGHGEAAGGLFSIDNTACGYVQNKSRVCPCLGRHTQASRRPRPPAGGSGRSYGGGKASRLGPMG